MTKVQIFWAAIVRLTPGFGKPDNTKVTMTIGNVRKLIGSAHKNGFHCGMQTAKSLEGLGKTADHDGDMLDLFKKMQGK